MSDQDEDKLKDEWDEQEQSLAEEWASLKHPGPVPEELREKPRAPVKVEVGPEVQVRMAKMWAIAINFVAYVVAGGFLGGLIDYWQGTSKPWFLLGGLILGLVYGFYKFIREALAANRPKPKP